MSGHNRKLVTVTIRCRLVWLLLSFLFIPSVSGQTNTISFIADDSNSTISPSSSSSSPPSSLGNNQSSTFDFVYTSPSVLETTKSFSVIARLLNQTLKVGDHHHQDDNLALLRPIAPKESFAQPVDEVSVESQQNLRLVHAYSVFYQELQLLADELLSRSAQGALDLLKQLSISSQCFSSLVTLAAGLRQHRPWAIQLLDSYGRIPAGMLQGTSADLGDYQECLDVQYESKSRTDEPFQGKYCLLTLKPLLPSKPNRLFADQNLLNFTGTSVQGTVLDEYSKSFSHFYSAVAFNFGICVPSTCSRIEVQQLIFDVLVRLKVPLQQAQINSKCSVRKQSWSPNQLQMASLIILAVISFLTLMATSLDLLFRCHLIHNSSSDRQSVRVLLCFSALSNTLSLFPSRKSSLTHSTMSSTCSSLSVHRTKLHKARNSIISLNLPKERKWSTITSGSTGSNEMTSVHKINLKFLGSLRLLSMVWLILVNNYMFGGYFRILYVYKNTHSILRGLSSPLTQLTLLSGHLSVDTLLLLSALLNSVSMVSHLSSNDSNRSLASLHWPLGRRVLVHWIALVGAQSVFIGSLGLLQGPVGSAEQLHYLRVCQQGWWANLLFASNWLPAHALCNFAGWPLSVNTQLMIISPFVVFALHRNIRAGVKLCLSIILIGTLLSGASVIWYDLQPALTTNILLDENALRHFVQYFLLPTYQHLVSYVSGLLCGFFVHFCYAREVKLHKLTLVMTTITMTLITILMLLLPLSWQLSPPTDVIRFTYAAFLRPIWSLLLCSIVFTVLTIKPLKLLLTWSRLKPLLKLILCASLVHLVPIYLRYFNLQHTREWNHIEFVSGSIVDVFFSVWLAFYLHITFEKPVRNLCQLYSQSRSSATLIHINNLNDVQC